jgi:hypothetical protein
MAWVLLMIDPGSASLDPQKEDVSMPDGAKLAVSVVGGGSMP